MKFISDHALPAHASTAESGVPTSNVRKVALSKMHAPSHVHWTRQVVGSKQDYRHLGLLTRVTSFLPDQERPA